MELSVTMAVPEHDGNPVGEDNEEIEEYVPVEGASIMSIMIRAKL